MAHLVQAPGHLLWHQPADLATATGSVPCSVYTSLDTISGLPSNNISLTVTGLDPSAAAVTLSLAASDNSATCSDSAATLWTAGDCFAGTAPDDNPQLTSSPAITVFKGTQCAPCDTGAYCPTGVFQACAAGSANSIVGSSSCIACPSGTVSDVGAEVCQQCDAGQLPSATRDYCVNCPGGTFSIVPGASSCQPCPAGTFRNPEADGTKCIKCAPGSYSSGGASECTLCAPGTATDQEGTTPDATTGGCPNW